MALPIQNPTDYIEVPKDNVPIPADVLVMRGATGLAREAAQLPLAGGVCGVNEEAAPEEATSLYVRTNVYVRVAQDGTLTNAQRGQWAYVVDGSTVSASPGFNGVRAGRVYAPDGAGHVWIWVQDEGAGRSPVNDEATDLASALALVNELRTLARS